MSSRRSARLEDQDAQEPVAVPKPTILGKARNSKKRKGPEAHGDGRTVAKKKGTNLAIGKSTALSQAHSRPSIDALSTLPPELLSMVLDNIKDSSTMSKLGRTCKRYYSLTMPLLHKRVAVAAMFHAHIAKLIRALEPLLTTAQKKQLKKEGKYKGQEEHYSSRLDANTKPACASYVRQIVVGVADPGRKHEYIVHRYVEEVFKNINELEVVEAYFLTESMGECIASLKNLQALRLNLGTPEAEAVAPLAKIKNLKHLSIEWGDSNENIVVQSMLLNSASTLRSLLIEKGSFSFATSFLQDWEEKVSANDVLAKQKHSLSALKSLSLSGVSFDAMFMKSLQKAVDFMGLCELRLGHFSGGKHLLLQALASLASSSQKNSTCINLRSLCLDMAENRHSETIEQRQTNFEATCSFISAFDTLTSLEIREYNQYSDTIPTNPGLPGTLLQAILRHKNLRNLKISYAGIISNHKIPYLSATTVATLVDNLPQLRSFEFAPEEARINEIGEALSRGMNLTSINCFPHDSWAGWPQPDDPGLNILTGIVNGFLSRDIVSGSEKFIWEDHFKLKHVSVTYKQWDIASKFGKPQKGMKKAEKLKSPVDEKREVLYRDITATVPIRIHVGYDPDFTWVEKVAKEIA